MTIALNKAENGAERARTANPRVANAVLSQLSYGPCFYLPKYMKSDVHSTMDRWSEPMTKRTTLAALMLLIGLGCKHEQVAVKSAPTATPAPVIAPDTTGKVIVHIVSRNQTITVKSGKHGVVYSVRDARGNVMLADASEAELQKFNPLLYQQIRHYIAVQADASSAIEASGLQDEPEPFSLDASLAR
jgi:hypothetical protein